MPACFKTRCYLVVFCLALLAFTSGCSDEENPVAPDDGGVPSNTPPVPTVSNANDQLPNFSETLAVEKAMLSNFSPKMSDQCSILSTLNGNAIALRFRMNPGYGQLVKDDAPCPPSNLQWATYGYENWSDCVLNTSSPLFDYLDSNDGSHYYGLNTKSYWMVLDLNSRLAGGNLVTIDSADENNFVHGLRNVWNPLQYMAIGFYDWGRTNGDFAWRSGDPVNFTSWSGNEPNDQNGEYFTIMATTGPVWNDVRGTDPVYGIMETTSQLPDQGTDDVPVLLLGDSPLYLGDSGCIAERPYVVRSVYWEKVFQRTLGAGASYSQTHSYMEGTEETTCMSFGYSIGVTVGLGWGPVTAEISSEFHQDFNRELSVYMENEVSDTYECTAPAGKTVIFALWHLVETYTICNADGEPWTDSGYTLDGPLPVLVQGLDQDYLQTLYFDQ